MDLAANEKAVHSDFFNGETHKLHTIRWLITSFDLSIVLSLLEIVLIGIHGQDFYFNVQLKYFRAEQHLQNNIYLLFQAWKLLFLNYTLKSGILSALYLNIYIRMIFSMAQFIVFIVLF